MVADKLDNNNGGLMINFTGQVGTKSINNFLAFNDELNVRGKMSTGPRYRRIDTGTVLESVARVAEKMGHRIESVTARASGRTSTKHVVRVRFSELRGTGDDKYFPELVLFNSYDGEQSLKLSTGLFRLICSNGLTIGEGITEHDRVRHVQGPVTEDFIKKMDYQIAACISALEGISGTVQRLQNTPLTMVAELKVVNGLGLSKRMQKALSGVRAGRYGRDTAPNMWAFYNAVNEVLRRGGRGGLANEVRNDGLLQTIEQLAA
jgi:hypothetical protein